jgi:hypothetical protein
LSQAAADRAQERGDGELVRAAQEAQRLGIEHRVPVEEHFLGHLPGHDRLADAVRFQAIDEVAQPADGDLFERIDAG